VIYKKRQWDDSPVPFIYVDNFLDEQTCLKLHDECLNAPRGGWTLFSRAGSEMEEYNDLFYTKTAHRVTYDLFHSGEFIYELEQLTGIVGLMPDPHLVGAGFSRFRKGSDLKIHYDFNWNDRLRLHRKLTCFLFLNPNWKESWGGHQQYYWNREGELIDEVAPMFNRFVMFENKPQWPYHSVRQISAPKNQVRTALRIFYYVSSSEYDENDPPHRSIYDTDEYTHTRLYDE